MRKAGATPAELNAYLNQNDQYRAQYRREADSSEICCGQVAGLISDVRGAGDVVRDVAESISTCFEELKHQLDDAFGYGDKKWLTLNCRLPCSQIRLLILHLQAHRQDRAG